MLVSSAPDVPDSARLCVGRWTSILLPSSFRSPFAVSFRSPSAEIATGPAACTVILFFGGVDRDGVPTALVDDLDALRAVGVVEPEDVPAARAEQPEALPGVVALRWALLPAQKPPRTKGRFTSPYSNATTTVSPASGSTCRPRP